VGKVKQELIVQQEREMANDNYLTMARIMDRELKKFIKSRESEWRNMTGKEQIITKASFQSGLCVGLLVGILKRRSEND